MKSIIPQNTNEFVALLKNNDELLEIYDEVDPQLDLATFHRQVVSLKGKALLFHNVKGTKFKVATNLYGSYKRLELAFGGFPANDIKHIVEMIQHFPSKLNGLKKIFPFVKRAIHCGTKTVLCPQNKFLTLKGLHDLPQIKCWPQDGGSFITLPLVYTQHPQTAQSNLGMYRVQLYDERTCGMHIQIQRGGGFHYHQAQKLNQDLPVHIYVGGLPALTLSAIAPLPENVPEVLLASWLAQKKIKQANFKNISKLPVFLDADFCIVGHIPRNQTRLEGPFGDHYGYYSLAHEFPFVNVDHVLAKKNAIYPATVVGRPPQEDHYLACFLQELFKPVLQMMMPGVHEVWAYEESGVHSLCGAVVKDRYPREALVTALRLMGEGQLSLSKVLLVTDAHINVKSIIQLLVAVLERTDFLTDLLFLAHSSLDTLDYTSGKMNHGSKLIWLGVGAVKRKLATEFKGWQMQSLGQTKVFCSGVLVVQAPKFSEDQSFAQCLASNPDIASFCLVIVVDDVLSATQSHEAFVWHVFTRFEPARDIFVAKTQMQRFHVGLVAPVVIDCRLKPWYPDILKSDEESEYRMRPLVEKYLA